MVEFVDIEYLDTYKDLELPELSYQYEGDACVDLRAVKNYVIYPTFQPKDITMVETGIKVKFSKYKVMFIFPRGSTHKKGITMANNVGVVDSGYRGEIKLPIMNFTQEQAFIQAGERIAQFMIVDANVMILRPTESVDDGSERGEGRFGSSNRK